MTQSAAILLLAAGAATRMRGADKMLQPVDGAPCIRAMAARALATGARVVVTLPPDRPLRGAALAGIGVETVVVPNAALGMSASIITGLGAIGAASGVMIVPADMPGLGTSDFAEMLALHRNSPDRILRACTAGGEMGHPVLFPRQFFAELSEISGDMGARAVLARHADAITPVPLLGDRALLDLDTPEAWQAYRNRSASSPGTID